MSRLLVVGVALGMLGVAADVAGGGISIGVSTALLGSGGGGLATALGE